MGILFTLLAIIAIIVVGVIALRVLGSAFKAFSLVFFILLFLLVIIGYFFVQDVQFFRQSFSENSTVYILDDSGTLHAGFSMRGFNVSSFTPIPFETLESYLQEDSDRIRIVVKREALNSGLQTNMTQGYSLAQTIESPDYQLRATGFMVGVLATIREDSVFSLARLVRDEKIAIFPETFAIKLLTFDSKEYKDELLERYQGTKESLFDTLGVRGEEV